MAAPLFILLINPLKQPCTIYHLLMMIQDSLFYGYGLGQVAGFIHVKAFGHTGIVSQQL